MIGGKTAATVAFAAMLAVTAAANLPGGGDAARDKVVCTDFATFDEAQQALLGNANNAVTLDPDGNGIACEEVFPAESAAAATATAAALPGGAAPAGNAERKAARQATATAEAAAEATQTPTPEAEPQDAKAEKKAARQTATAEAAAVGGNADRKAARQATATAEAAAAGQSPKKNPKKTPTPEATHPTPVGGDLDCIDFAFQEDAQAVLDQNPKDPYNLDPNHDGIACSSLPRRGGPIVALPATGSGPMPPGGWQVESGL